MMGLSEREVASLLFNALLCGICLGGLYDLVRAFKMLCGVRYGEKKDSEDSASLGIALFSLTLVTDLLFWVFAGLASIILTYASGGVFRGSAYVVMACGFLLYYFTLGRAILALNRKITAFLRGLILKIARALLRKASKATGGIISLYHLTIGKIFDKIKDGKSSGNANEREGENGNIDTSETERGKEGFVYVERGKGYRREGRVSFGKRE